MIPAALLAAAAAAAQLPAICADRPSKANGTCTVPAGHWQIEASAADWARSSDGDSRTDMLSLGATVVKLGLSDNSDIEAGFSPLIVMSSREGSSRSRISGVGDMTVRYKRRLTQSDAAVQVALIPFVKLPTARHGLGNGKVEGGVTTPASLSLGGGLTATIGPEIDWLADDDGRGHHAALTNLLNLSLGVGPNLSVSAEIWNSLNFDPAGTMRLWSFDASAAYMPSRRLQLDVGATLGLNRATPALELYAGASVLF